MLYNSAELQNEPNYALTKNTLQSISSHIVNRSKYNQYEFTVKITSNSNVSEIEINPTFELFPDVHHRKPTDKEWVLEHVFKDHIPAHSFEVLQNGHVVCSPKLSDGIYEFKFMSSKTKRRRWFRKI